MQMPPVHIPRGPHDRRVDNAGHRSVRGRQHNHAAIVRVARVQQAVGRVQREAARAPKGHLGRLAHRPPPARRHVVAPERPRVKGDVHLERLDAVAALVGDKEQVFARCVCACGRERQVSARDGIDHNQDVMIWMDAP